MFVFKLIKFGLTVTFGAFVKISKEIQKTSFFSVREKEMQKYKPKISILHLHLF